MTPTPEELREAMEEVLVCHDRMAKYPGDGLCSTEEDEARTCFCNVCERYREALRVPPTPSTNVEAQEAVVGALHGLLRANDEAWASGKTLWTGNPPGGPPYTFDEAAIGDALSQIMEAFGYGVQPIQ